MRFHMLVDPKIDSVKYIVIWLEGCKILLEVIAAN